MEEYLWLIIDLIGLAFLVLFVLKGRADGFAKTVVRAAGLLIAILGGAFLSTFLAPLIYDSFLSQPLSDLIASTIAEHENISEIAASLEESLPAILSNAIVATTGMSLSQQAASLTGDLHLALMETVSPVMIALVRGILFAVIFGVLRILVSVISKKLSFVNKIPLLGKLNQALGALLGLAEGLFYLLLFVLIIGWVSGATNYAIPYLTKEVLDSSYLFRLVGFLDPVGFLKNTL